jgi:glycosyltransferase involved in cell wall biosynthesis
LRYPEYEIIVVNDGSKDNTLGSLIEAFNLQPVKRAVPRRVAYEAVRGIYDCNDLPNLLVVDKDNGGKADALNAAMDLASHPYVCSVDADSLLDSDARARRSEHRRRSRPRARVRLLRKRCRGEAARPALPPVRRVGGPRHRRSHERRTSFVKPPRKRRNDADYRRERS